MSKMSQLHAELSEQAAELGFESIEQAEANGYVIYYEPVAKLIPTEEAAHKDLMLEKEKLLSDLDLVVARSQFDKRVIERAKEMIRTEVK